MTYGGREVDNVEEESDGWGDGNDAGSESGSESSGDETAEGKSTDAKKLACTFCNVLSTVGPCSYIGREL